MNPFQLFQMFQNAQNPYALVQQLAGNNPQMQQVVNNLQGKTPQELEQYARNVAQSKGINLNQYLKQFGLNIPSTK